MNELTAKDATASLTLAQKLELIKQRVMRPALLLDTSGSMSSELEPGCSKIQALCGIVGAMKLYGVDVYEFNSLTRKVNIGLIDLLRATGGTNMAFAFQVCKQDGHNKAVIITDGQPDSQSQALEASKDMQLEIIYVGPGNRPKFLDKLA